MPLETRAELILRAETAHHLAQISERLHLVTTEQAAILVDRV